VLEQAIKKTRKQAFQDHLATWQHPMEMMGLRRACTWSGLYGQCVSFYHQHLLIILRKNPCRQLVNKAKSGQILRRRVINQREE
jgi:hypothetical protein